MSIPVKSEYSGQSGSFEVDGHSYTVQLLNVEHTFKLQFILSNQLAGLASGKGLNIDPDTMWNLAVKLLKFAEVDGAPLDMQEHFACRVDSLDMVVVEALKANAPDFFKRMSGTIVTALQGQFGSVTKASQSATSSPVTATSAKR